MAEDEKKTPHHPDDDEDDQKACFVGSFSHDPVNYPFRYRPLYHLNSGTATRHMHTHSSIMHSMLYCKNKSAII